MHIARKREINTQIKIIGEKKRSSTSIFELCSGLPLCFIEYLKYVESLTFEADIDYSFLKKIFRQELAKQETSFDFVWLQQKYHNHEMVRQISGQHQKN